MRCPFCTSEETQVKDSRPTEDKTSIRRRRLCDDCGARFTTFERVQLRELNVSKGDGQTELLERDKIVRSMLIATRKRNIDDEKIEMAANSIVRQLESMGEKTIETNEIGRLVMAALLTMDKVAYIRYASVYKDFKEEKDFKEFIESVE